VTSLALALLLGAGEPVKPPAVVRVLPPEAVLVVPGGSADVRLEVTVAPGFHVQANPASEPYLIPLKLELKPAPGLRPGKVTYPPGRPYRLRGATSDLSTYGGSFDVRVHLEAEKGAATGERRVEGSLRYQACDDRVCLRPASVAVEIPVTVDLGDRGRRGARP
jgi:hypothetical protein